MSGPSAKTRHHLKLRHYRRATTMPSPPIHNRKSVEDLRKALRHSPTEAEALLWSKLRRSQLAGKKFRRQHSIGNYIVDFYCPEQEACGGVGRQRSLPP